MKKLLIILLSIIATILLSTTILYISISNSLSENSIKNSIKDNLLTDISHDENGNNSEIFNQIINETGIDESTLNRIMEDDDINNSISEIVSSVYNYNLTGDDNYKITSDEITSMIEDNINKIATISEYDISEEEKEEMLKYIKENSQELIDILYNVDLGEYNND